MKHKVLDKPPGVYTVSTVFEALEQIDILLDPHGLEVVMWDDGIAYPYYSFSIVARDK